MRTASALLLTVLLLSSLTLAESAETNSPQIPESSYEWWRAARFGIFIHWNASSVLQLGEGSWSRKNPTEQGHDYHKKGLNEMRKEPPPAIADGSYKKYLGKGGVPMEIYDNLYHVFNPSAFDAEAWVKTFKDAGAGYVVFTTKHHDGFCMFDTRLTDYKITSTPFKRDVCRELAEAWEAWGARLRALALAPAQERAIEALVEGHFGTRGWNERGGRGPAFSAQHSATSS